MEQIRKWRLDESEIWFDLGRISQKWDLWINDSRLGIFYSIRKRIHSFVFIQNNSAMNLNYRVLFSSISFIWDASNMRGNEEMIHLDDPAIIIIFLRYKHIRYLLWHLHSVQNQLKKKFFNHALVKSKLISLPCGSIAHLLTSTIVGP